MIEEFVDNNLLELKPNGSDLIKAERLSPSSSSNSSAFYGSQQGYGPLNPHHNHHNNQNIHHLSFEDEDDDDDDLLLDGDGSSNGGKKSRGYGKGGGGVGQGKQNRKSMNNNNNNCGLGIQGGGGIMKKSRMKTKNFDDLQNQVNEILCEFFPPSSLFTSNN